MAKDDPKAHAGLSAALFPHSGLSDEGLGRILSFFERLTLFVPWHMRGPVIQGAEGAFLRVSHPPESMTPVADFRSLLSEYGNWMTFHDLKGYTPLLRANLAKPPEEPTTQAIRGELRTRERGEASRDQDPFTGWHLLLHLNRQMEEREEEASGVLRALRLGGSPLREAVGEETVGGLFDDLPPFDANPLQEPHALGRVCEAWFGLFGGSLRKEDLLLTRNPHLLTHLSELWEEYRGEEHGREHSVVWLWPDLSGIDPGGPAPERKRVFQDERAGALKDALRDFQRDPGQGLSGLQKASGGLDRAWVQRYSPRILRFSTRHFPRRPEGSPEPEGKTLASVLDRVIIHVEEAPGHEDT